MRKPLAHVLRTAFEKLAARRFATLEERLKAEKILQELGVSSRTGDYKQTPSPPQPGYPPPQQPGYPTPQQPGYPTPQSGYPTPQQPGYPTPQQPGYPTPS